VPGLLAQENTLNLIAHPHDGAKECPHGLGTYSHCNLMIGPEGKNSHCIYFATLEEPLCVFCQTPSNVTISHPPQNTPPNTHTPNSKGGFVTPEMSTWIDLGFEPVSLGRRILPVATAVHVLHGKLHVTM
jgi:hypothetical protein